MCLLFGLLQVKLYVLIFMFSAMLRRFPRLKPLLSSGDKSVASSCKLFDNNEIKGIEVTRYDLC